MSARQRGLVVTWSTLAGLSLIMWLTACHPQSPAHPHSLDLIAELNLPKLANPSLAWRFDTSSNNPPTEWTVSGDASRLTVESGSLHVQGQGPLQLRAQFEERGLFELNRLRHILFSAKASKAVTLRLEGISVRDGAEHSFPLATTTLPALDKDLVFTISLEDQSFPANTLISALKWSLEPEQKTHLQIRSLRMMFEEQPSGSGNTWARRTGLKEIYRDAVVCRGSTTFSLEAKPGERAWLDVAMGLGKRGPVRFTVDIETLKGQRLHSVQRTLAEPAGWERSDIDLSRWPNQRLRFHFKTETDHDDAQACWGTLRIRHQQTPTPKEARPRHVILIVIDTLRRDHLETYGHHRQTAPALARLAANGWAFDRAIAPSSWTKPSVPALLSSINPRALGVEGLYGAVPSSVTTLAECFQAAGYATFGASSISYTGRQSHLDQGFDIMLERGALPTMPRGLNSKTAKAVVDRFLPWLEQHRQTSFFAMLHVMDPHHPYETYPPWNELWSAPDANKQIETMAQRALEGSSKFPDQLKQADLTRAGVDPDAFIRVEKDWYDEAIRAADEELNRLLIALENHGILNDTLLVLTSDHGEEFFDHGGRHHGHHLYGELINVPLIMHHPSSLNAGKSPQLISQLDVAPTILEMSGLPIPQHWEGHSLIPLRSEKGAAHASPWPVFASVIKEGRPGRQSFLAHLEARWKTVRTTDNQGNHRFELFDHLADPLDQTNLADQYPDALARAQRQMTLWDERVAKLAKELQAREEQAMLDRGFDPEELELLRSLGYLGD